MNRIVTLVTFFVLMTSFEAFAQTVDLKWEPAFQQAVTDARLSDKPILLFFSGSDWCKPCMKLKKFIIETETFSRYSEKFVLYNADFPYRTRLPEELAKANEELAAKYNAEGKFPKIVYLSPDLKILGSTGFIDCSPDEYIQKIESILKK